MKFRSNLPNIKQMDKSPQVLVKTNQTTTNVRYFFVKESKNFISDEELNHKYDK